MRIRKAKQSDAKEIYGIRIETIEKINSKDYTKKEIQGFKSRYSVEEMLKRINEREMFCAIIDNRIVGTVDLEGNKIGSLFVKADYTNKGIGKHLLAFIEDHARKKGIKKLRLFSTRTGYGFYLKQGYKPSKAKKEDYQYMAEYFNKKLEKRI